MSDHVNCAVREINEENERAFKSRVRNHVQAIIAKIAQKDIAIANFDTEISNLKKQLAELKEPVAVNSELLS